MPLDLIEEHNDVDNFTSIIAHLDRCALGRLASSNHYFTEAVVGPQSIHRWDELCTETWRGKVHVAAEAVALRSTGDPRGALRQSLADAQRTDLTDEELTSFEWRFRFKEQAGPQWQQFDPYWTTGEPTRAQFMPATIYDMDGHGTVRMSGFEAIEDFYIQWWWPVLNQGPVQNTQLRDSFGVRTLQVSVNGSRVPRYLISRHENWGWIMQSCWVVYLSFPMPKPGVDPSLDDRSLLVDVDMQRREAAVYNMGWDIDDEEEEESEEEENEDDEEDEVEALEGEASEEQEEYEDEEDQEALEASAGARDSLGSLTLHEGQQDEQGHVETDIDVETRPLRSPREEAATAAARQRGDGAAVALG